MSGAAELPEHEASSYAREPSVHELPPSFAPLYHSFAFESGKRSNLHYLDEVHRVPGVAALTPLPNPQHQQRVPSHRHLGLPVRSPLLPLPRTPATEPPAPARPDQDGTLVFAAGGIVHFLDLAGMTCSYLPSIGGNAIGCVEVHTARQLIAVCEIGTMPNVFVYEYPSLRLRRVLKNGTERAYSAANFSNDGSKLATVGSFPDYMLTVWDWDRESIILRTKAFAQEVYRVSFSPNTEGQLVTGTREPRRSRRAALFLSFRRLGIPTTEYVGILVVHQCGARPYTCNMHICTYMCMYMCM